MQNIRLCILDADHINEALVSRFDSYAAMFVTMFRAIKPDLEIDIFKVIDGEYPPEDSVYDAYLLTGSKFDAFGDDDWIVQLRAYVKQGLDDQKCFLGVCFGHQLLALVSGGDVARAPCGWGIGVQDYRFVAKPSWLGTEQQQFAIIASHQDQVLVLPKDFQLLATSDYCPNAAFYYNDQIFAIQGHPEFQKPYAQALLESREDSYPAELVNQAKASLDRPIDSKLIATAMLNFMCLNKN